MTDAPSAGGRPYINITIMDVEAEEGRWDFYDRYRGEKLGRARSGEYADYRSLPGGGAGQYIYGGYILQPQDGDCRYNVLEHAYPSWNAPGEYSFIISVGICEADLPEYDQQRSVILDSFNEIE